MLTRYQDSLVQGEFRGVVMNEDLLARLGFREADAQPEGSEATVYQLNNGSVSVINRSEFIFEGGEKGRVSVDYLHLLQQTWRQTFEEELITDFLEQPHEIIVE